MITITHERALMDLVSASTRLNVFWEIDDTMEKVRGKATCFKVSIYMTTLALCWSYERKQIQIFFFTLLELDTSGKS